MNLTNKKIILIYALSPFLIGVVDVLFRMFLKESLLSSLIIHINIPYSYLIDYLQVISIVSGISYAYGAISFLLLIVIPSRLIVRLTLRECLMSRLIKCVGILVGFRIFFYSGNENKDFLSMLVVPFIYVVGYVIFFYLIPKKITGIPEKQSRVDQCIHIILSGIIGVALCILWEGLFPENIKNTFLVLFTSYFIGVCAVIFFCIPAMIVGIIRVRISHMKPIVQVIICSITGLLFSFGFGLFFGEYWSIALCIAGGITALLVTIIVNLLDTSKKQVSVKQA